MLMTATEEVDIEARVKAVKEAEAAAADASRPRCVY